MYIEYRDWCPCYPYAIKNSWGQIIETDKEELEELVKEIQKVLDKSDKI
jgi:hypothetical protein